MTHQHDNIGKPMVRIDGIKLLSCLPNIPRKVMSSWIVAELLTQFAWLEVGWNVKNPMISRRFQFAESDQLSVLEQLEVGRLTSMHLFLGKRLKNNLMVAKDQVPHQLSVCSLVHGLRTYEAVFFE